MPANFGEKVGGLPEVVVLSPTLTQLTESSPSQTELADTITNATRSQYGPFAQNPAVAADTAALNRRVRLLEEAEYSRYYADETDAEDKEELAEELKRKDLRLTLFHNVISRIQKFDSNGRYLGADRL